jgi:hypothetical protein
LGTRICTAYDPNPQVVAADHLLPSREHDLDTISRQSFQAACCFAEHIEADVILIAIKSRRHAPPTCETQDRGAEATLVTGSVDGFLHGIRHKVAGRRPALPLF